MIFVTGCPRSGTSLTAGVLAACGALFGAEAARSTLYNQKGQYEHSTARRENIKSVLTGAGYDPLGCHPLPPKTETFADAVIQLPEDVTAFKDPKLVLVWKAWARAYPAARWVVTNRDRREIQASMSRTPWFRNVSAQKLIIEYELRGDALTLGVQHARRAYPASLVRGDMDHARELVEWCGLEWNEAAVREWIDAKLWHGRNK